MNYKKIATDRALGNKQSLYEASLSRILDHVGNSKERSFAILSSWRQSNAKKENLLGMKELKSAIRGLGLGFVPIKGHWRECQDSTVSYADCPEEDLVDAVEPSLFVIGLSMEQALSLGKQFLQDAIVYSGPETEGHIKLLFGDGTDMDIGDFAPNTVGQAYSELIKSKLSAPRSFKFEGFECTPSNFIESLIEEQVRKILAKIAKQ